MTLILVFYDHSNKTLPLFWVLLSLFNLRKCFISYYLSPHSWRQEVYFTFWTAESWKQVTERMAMQFVVFNNSGRANLNLLFPMQSQISIGTHTHIQTDFWDSINSTNVLLSHLTTSIISWRSYLFHTYHTKYI